MGYKYIKVEVSFDGRNERMNRDSKIENDKEEELIIEESSQENSQKNM